MWKNILAAVFIVFLLILALGGYYFYSNPDMTAPVAVIDLTEKEQPIGGERDEHGCLGPAGYTWCEAKEKCLRVFEEGCDDQILDLVNTVKQISEVEFENNGEVSFDWMYQAEENIDRTEVIGLEFFANGIGSQEYMIIEDYFKETMEEDIYNMASGPMGNMEGFWFNYNVCILGYQFSNSTQSEEGMVIPDTTARNVNIRCGFLNKNILYKGKQVNNFQDCVTAGYVIMESYPRQCRDNEDNLFVEYIGNELEKTDLIHLDNPRPNQTIVSPLQITGQARGNWFFEGDFPVILTNWDGEIIAEGYATAQGDWMTEDFVPFTVEIIFKISDNWPNNKGTLILRKDNPSGLPENDDALEVPVYTL